MWKLFIRSLLFQLDAEKAHHLTFRLLRIWFAIPGLRFLTHRAHHVRDPRLERELFGLRFRNPVGLAAGFDKNGLLIREWGDLGFGFVEVGTVTPKPQAGNPQPRLFRLPKDQAIINRMGFNNDGLDVLAGRLRAARRGRLIVAGNIGKNKDTANADAASDYEKCFEALYEHVDFFVVNVSSPNTPGLRELQEKAPLTALLQSLQTLNAAKPKQKPILLKIAPDLTDSQLDDILEIVQTTGLAGLVATNTTISRAGLATAAAEVEAIGAGGLSGAPLRARSMDVLRYLRARAPKLPLISVGGIMTADDAVERLAAGADLVQVYTGFVYGGAYLPKRICRKVKDL
ncbi:MAG TPA: quinone-dependent dihydroorotate dehydrogenase [Bacteroidia bacterium]|nr:quinone-dependent dihydroorotate dehydrogenase [Bacteroidia bacterium]